MGRSPACGSEEKEVQVAWLDTADIRTISSDSLSAKPALCLTPALQLNMLNVLR